MELADIFYIIGIIFMLGWLALIIAVIYFIKKISETLDNVVTQGPERIQTAVSNLLQSNKGNLVSMAGMALVSFLVPKLGSILKRK
ncbi:MAG: hypothetical protein ACEQSA_04350 [Weeksellaceae bacterium]